MDGIINVYKEKGFTSHDVVAKLRGILKMKKIGHTGTLDPQAEGVLPVCLGKATKLCDFITDRTKTYKAVLLLGKVTDTLDVFGRVIEENECNVSAEEIAQIIKSFVGKQEQVPPMYSALKVNGKKLYELAREGKTIERQSRVIEIFSIEISEISLPRVTFTVTCSKGTYIRSLCDDIGKKAGCGGCMEELTRTRSGNFDINSALKLDEIQALVYDGRIEEHLMKMDSVFNDYSSLAIKKEYNKMLYNGNKMPVESIKKYDKQPNQNETVKIYDENGCFIGIYEFIEKEKSYKPVKLFI